VPLTDDTPLLYLVAKRLKISPSELNAVSIIRQAIDARRKNKLSFVYTIEVDLKNGQETIPAHLFHDTDISLVTLPEPQPLIFGTQELSQPPVVVGAGPCGLFAAYTLAKYGYKPLLLERGHAVDKRAQAVAEFWRTGVLDETSNAQFGEGGAGTFSDGKLTTRVNDSAMSAILDVLVKAGAPPEIKYQHKPHIGTDKLKAIVKNIRQEIIAHGGTVRFGACLTDISLADGKINAITVNHTEKIPCGALFLAIGHSARDTYAMLSGKLELAAKNFAIGLRIEHPQELIDQAQYGPFAGHPKLGAADYALTYQDKASGRAAYSFCMCPGGVVVAAASEQGQVVTNGMSNYQRNSGFANSALIVPVGAADFGSGTLGGIEFQRRYEKLAFALGGGSYAAPVQAVAGFLQGQSTTTPFLSEPSYTCGVRRADLNQCLPGTVAAVLKNALLDFGRKIKGFDHPQAVLTGVETRTSAPVRILRGADFQALNLTGIYPVGEGAGYAGGIMSAALDGRSAALSFLQQFKPIS
jgi:uncharacterized FAD-dependent dehydrogenase